MIGLPFITALFANVLGASRGIEGRFIYCPKQGAEINMFEFDQVIREKFSSDPDAKIYPADFMLPPISRGTFIDPAGEWETYDITNFFLTTTYSNSFGQPKDPNESTGTSMHTVLQDQHDMGRCARNFIAVLNQLSRNRSNPLIKDRFRLNDQTTKRILPVSFIGAAVLAGVRLDFQCQVFNGCKIEDYDPNQIAMIPIPETDPHPEHNL